MIRTKGAGRFFSGPMLLATTSHDQRAVSEEGLGRLHFLDLALA
jgi:hypothetical protein